MQSLYSWEKGRVVPPFDLRIVQEIVTTPFPQSFDLYCALMDVQLKPWQREDCLKLIQCRSVLLNWGRGMSKTFIFALVAVFLGLFDLRIIYLVPRVDELEQPLEYFNANPFCDLNPHNANTKMIVVEKGRWFRVAGHLAIKINNIDDHGFNLSSGRFNVVMFDECALLMYYAKEKELYNKAQGMLRSMDYPHTHYASTPLIGSHFVMMLEDKKKAEDSIYSWRNFQNTPDNFLTDTEDKAIALEEEHQAAIRQGIEYAWETENLALPRTATGAAFKNFIEEPYVTFAQKVPNRIGFDFHGYAFGHVWVALAYNPTSHPNHVFVIAEGQERYEEQDNADESMEFLGKNILFQTVLLYGEGDVENMINGPFLKAGQTYGMQAVNIEGQEKYNLEANILNFTWHIDRLKTPFFYTDFTESEWADPNVCELHKEASGSKFRNHYLDAAKVALPKARGQTIYIPNKNIHASRSFVEQDRQRRLFLGS